MSYLVLARKYRPGSFASLAGQEQVTRTLKNAIKRDKIAHAFLFAGPRGVGKTSVARILSKALNCKEGPTEEPCLKCTNCSEISAGTSLAVREIDGASHNSVDNVRELIESFRSLPAPGYRYKIYIIDEVHMLSISAFNALLKSLEEPPPNTVFILATTEAHKIPETVISRCQRHDFRALRSEDIFARLTEIVAEEKISAEPHALRALARYADGSMRDAQSLLDRVQSFCDEKISAKDVSDLLGVVDQRVLFDLSQAIFSRNAETTLSLIDAAFSRGLDAGLFLKEFVGHWRQLYMAKFGGEEALKSLGLLDADSVELRRQVEQVSTHDLHDLTQLARDGCDKALRTAYPRFALEALCVRMATRVPVKELAELLAQAPLQAAPGRAPESAPRAMPATPQPEISAPIPKQPKPPLSAGGKADTPQALGEVEWENFVRHVGQSGARMLSEHLKRLSLETFAHGALSARGSESVVSYFKQKGNLEKLQSTLESYFRIKPWRIEFHNGEPAEEKGAGSIKAREEQRRSDYVVEKKENIANRPKLKSLQKVFPGSKIENIKIQK